MLEEVILPRLDQGMEEGMVGAWLVAPGEDVTAGTAIVEIETDKVTTELEAPSDGQLLRISVEAGDRVPVGTVLGWFGDGTELPPDDEEGTDSGSVARPVPEQDGEVATDGRSTVPGRGPGAPSPGSLAPDGDAERDHALPRDRSDWQRPHTQSPRARSDALLGDGRDLAGEAITPDEGQLLPLSPMRRAIVATVSRSWQIPQFDVTADVDVTAAIRMTQAWREEAEPPYVGTTDLLLSAMSRAVPVAPEVNAWFEEDGIRRFDRVDVTMLTQTDDGLVMLRLRRAEGMRLGELRDERRRLVAAAKGGRLTSEDLGTGTIALSNLGTYQIDRFNALLVPPQVAVLAVGRARPDPADRQLLALTLTVDHRAVDGADAARYLAELSRLLADPTLLLL